MKTTIITTIDHNVGDDFVREGIQFLLKGVFGPSSYSLIHKHIPLSARPEWEWFYHSGVTRMLDKLPRARSLFWSRIIDRLPLNPETDKVLDCDLLIQSGAPVYWKGAQHNEWFGPLIRERYRAHSRHVPFLNIGAGTCIPFHSDGKEVISDSECVAYIKELHGLCSVTTVRDTLSKQILNHIGLDAPVLPCPSIFARDNLGIKPQPAEYVALNFMPMGGHFDFIRGFDSSRWEKDFSLLCKEISSSRQVLFVCHDQREYDAALRIAPRAQRFIGRSAKDYLHVYAKASYYVGCRIHAAYATASFGRPAIIIGSDSRAHMASEIGLTGLFVNDTTVASLLEHVGNLEQLITSYPDRLDEIKQTAYNNYIKILEDVRESYFVAQPTRQGS